MPYINFQNCLYQKDGLINKLTFDEAKNEIKNRIDIVDIIGKDVNLKPISSGDFIGLCPFHNEKTPSFHVRQNQQYYHCFGCHKSGDIFKYLEEHDQMSFKEAMDYLCDKLGITYEKGNVDKSFNTRKQRVYDIYKEAAKEYFKLLISDKGKDGQEYFKRRKLTFNTIKKFGLGYAPDERAYMYNHLKSLGFNDTEIIDDAKIANIYNDKVYDVWRSRAMFPILDRMNKVITFSGRALKDDDERKYVNGYATIIFDKSNNLFCLNEAKNTKENYFILCEGNMDCISLYQAGYTNVIAPLGTAFTEKQASLLTRYNKKVYIAMDSDEAGVNAVRTKTIPYFDNLNIDTKVIDLKPCKDPDEFIVKYGKNRFDERIESAKDSIIFDILCMKNEYNLKEETGKRDYIEKIVEKLGNLKNQYTRDIYSKSVSYEINMDYQSLVGYVNEYIKNNNVSHKKASNINTENIFINKKISENKKNIDKNELSFIEILTDNMNLIYDVKKYIDVDDIENEVCKNIYKDIVSGVPIDQLISKYSNVNLDGNANQENQKIKNNLASDIIATNSNLSWEDAKDSLSLIIKKIKVASIERKIKSCNTDANDISSLFDELKTVKSKSFIL